MKPALILLIVLVLGGVVAWLLDKLMPGRKSQPDEASPSGQVAENAADEPAAEADHPQQGCTDSSCGLREVCPSEQLLAAACAPQVEYYDDEELDDYRGRAADAYTATELEQWRDVLYTLRGDDLMGWGHSIQRRGLVMPDAIRDEFIQLLSEHRQAHGQ